MLKKILITSILLTTFAAYASVTVTVNGTNYTIPQTNEKGWGAQVTSWIQGVSLNTLQKTGGTFTLTAETNFGSTYGLLAPYYKSSSSNLSTAGVLRLANTDVLGWRNAANSGNLLLAVDSSNRLTFNGSILPTLASSTFTDSGFLLADDGDSTKKAAFQVSGISTGTTRTFTFPDADTTLVGNATTQTLTNKTLSGNTAATLISGSGTLTLNTSGTATVPNATDTLVGKATTDTLTNKTIDGGSNTFTNVPLTTGVTGILPVANGGTNSSTTLNNNRVIQSSGGKIQEAAAITASRALVSDANGIPTHATTTSTEIGYVNGVTSAIQTQIDGKVAKSTLTAKGSIYAASAASTPAEVTVGANNTVLAADSSQASGVKWATVASLGATAPTVQYFTSTGTTAGYRFTVTAANATAGATYTNNGNTYTVIATIVGATTLYCTQASAPLASGTLTKATGSGDATITFSAAVAIASYTRPTSPTPVYIRVRTVGGGGGGGASGTSGGTAATVGNPSVFMASGLVLTATGGNPGGQNANGGAGGLPTISGGTGIALQGGGGVSSINEGSSGTINTGAPGGAGGNSAFAGGAIGVASGSGSGAQPGANTGAGGGGAAGSAAINQASGSGGGAGGFIDMIIGSPTTTYYYAVGTGGTGQAAGTAGSAGANGAAGVIMVEEFYQ